MDTEPLLITLARALDREHVDYRVFAEPASADASSPSHVSPSSSSSRMRKPHTELATIELNRRICFPDGRIHSIAHHGGLLSTDRELRRCDGTPDGAASFETAHAPREAPSFQGAGHGSGHDSRPPAQEPLAICHRERTGLLTHRRVLIVAGDAAGERERRFLLRRRHWFGSPANVDVVPLMDDASAPEPVVLRAEKSGTWRQRLQASWLSPKELSLPVVLFVLNVLADLDRRAAIAASAGAAGL